MEGIKKLILLTTSLFSVTAASYAFAACPLQKGIYITGDIGLTSLSGYGSTVFPANTTNKTSGKAWSGGLGYKFTPYIGAQADYTGYADTRIKDPGTITAARNSHHSIDVAAILILPVYSTGFEIYGKLGAAWISSRIHKVDPNEAAKYGLVFNTGNTTARGAYWGVGAQYYFNENVAAHIQYAQARGNSNTGNLGMTSLGLSMLFQV